MNTPATFAPLDDFDKQILKIMQVSNRITSENIAEKIGLSAAAVQRRIKRLRQQNIISADISVINPKSINRPLTLVVQVTLERERADLMDAFKKAMKVNSMVQQCYYVTGNSDFILIITAQDMDDYEFFTRRHFFDNANIRNFQTNVVMDRVKVGLELPFTEN